MIEKHPYGEFIPKSPKAMIIGSFPIGKFSHPQRHHEIKPHEFDFFFGGEKNLLWKLLGRSFSREINEVNDIISMLEEYGLAVGDVISSCERKNGGGSDSDLYNISWNLKLLKIIRSYNIRILYFTSKKVQGWFNRLFPDTQDLIKISLISPSGQSLRGLSRNTEFLEWKRRFPDKKSVEFIYDHYHKAFLRLQRNKDGK